MWCLLDLSVKHYPVVVIIWSCQVLIYHHKFSARVLSSESHCHLMYNNIFKVVIRSRSGFYIVALDICPNFAATYPNKLYACWWLCYVFCNRVHIFSSRWAIGWNQLKHIAAHYMVHGRKVKMLCALLLLYYCTIYSSWSLLFCHFICSLKQHVIMVGVK